MDKIKILDLVSEDNRAIRFLYVPAGNKIFDKSSEDDTVVAVNSEIPTEIGGFEEHGTPLYGDVPEHFMKPEIKRALCKDVKISKTALNLVIVWIKTYRNKKAA